MVIFTLLLATKEVPLLYGTIGGLYWKTLEPQNHGQSCKNHVIYAHMTTVTFDEDLQLPQRFKSLAAFLTYLEDHGLMVVLQELTDDEITEPMAKKAEDALKRYNEDPSSFEDI